tara:strand:- start:180 stop:428 length:249 start_codon:yes stop_codon:yes gene_type:complete
MSYLLKKYILEVISEEKNKKEYPEQYQAKGERKKTLDKATELAKSNDPDDRAKGRAMRDKMEEDERNKKGYKNTPSNDAKKS